MDFRLSKAFLDLSTFMITRPETRRLLTAIRNYAVNRLHAPMFFVGLYDRSSGIVSFEVAYEEGKKVKLEPINIRQQKRPSLVGQVIQAKQPITWMNRAQKDKAIKRFNLQPMGSGKTCRSCWIHPLEVDGELLGVISIQSPKSDAWKESDLTHFKALVYLAAIAIANARSLEKNKKNQKLFQNIQKAGNELISELEPNIILKKIVKHAVKTMGAWRSNIIIIDEDGNPTTRVAIGFNKNANRLLARKNGVSRGVIRTKLPRFFEDVNKKDNNQGMIDDGVKSALCMPFIYQGDVIGVMWGHYKEHIIFTEEIKDAWAAYATQAALAFGNANFVSNISRVKKIQDSLIDSSFDAIVAIDSHQRVVEFNEQAEKLLGFAFNEVEGKSAEMFYASLAEGRRINRRLIDEGQISNYPVTLKDRNNKHIPVLLSAKAIVDKPGNQISLQVGYIRDLQKTRSMEKKLGSLIEVGRAVNRSNKLNVVYKQVIEAALKSFPSAMNGVIHLFYEDRNLLYRMSDSGEVDTDNSKEVFKTGEGIAGWVFNHNKSIVLHDASKDPRYKIIRVPGYFHHKSMMCALMQVGNRPIGTITLHNTKKAGLFDEEDLKLLSAFADQVGIAIDNAKNYQRIIREESERKLVKTISEKLHKQQEVEPILKLLSDAGGKILGVEIAVAHLLDEITGEIVSYSAPEGYDIIPPRRLDTNKKGLTDVILDRGKIVIIEDVSVDPRVNPKVVEKGVKSLIGFPIISERSGPIGAIFFNSTEKTRFIESDLNLISLLISQSSTAIFNAMLHKRKQRRVDKLKLLSDFSQAIIHQLTTAKEIRQYRLILKFLAEILDAEGTSLLLMNPSGLLEKKACWGHLTENFDVGRQFKIHHQKGGGLTGWIAYKKETFKAHGEVLRNHPAVSGKGNSHLKSGSCSALLAIPLIEKINGKDQLIGMLEAENKLNIRGEVDDSLGFSDEDVWISDIFKKTALTILEISGAYRKTKELLERHSNSLGFLYRSRKEITDEHVDLPEILNNIAKRAWELTGVSGLHASFTDIFLIDGDMARLGAAYPLTQYRRIARRIGNGIPLNGKRPIGIVGRAIRTKEQQLIPNVVLDPHYLLTHKETKSELAIPIIFGTEVLGVINVEYKDKDAFNWDDIQDLGLLSVQAAIAIWNARYLEEFEKHNRYLQTIYMASKVISKGGIENKNEVLEAILEQAVELVKLTKGASVTLAAFQMIMPRGKNIRLECVFPPTAAEYAKVGDIRSLNPNHGKIGISGQAILEKRTIIVDDVNKNKYYVLINHSTQSEIDVPLKDGDRIIGTISLESNKPTSFNQRDQGALEALAELAVAALKNVDSYLDLKKNRGLVGSLTAVNWVNYAASTWGHSIRGKAINIGKALHFLREEVGRLKLIPEVEEQINERLEDIGRFSREISDSEIAAPSGNGLESNIILINDLIEEWLIQLMKKPKYSHIKIRRNFNKTKKTASLINPEMVRHAFDIIANNATDAMLNQSLPKTLFISTSIVEDWIEIHFTDSGKGIPEENKPKLFNEPKPDKFSSGMGMGLLIAQAIVQSNGGEIELVRSIPGDTEFMIKFPICGRQEVSV